MTRIIFALMAIGSVAAAQQQIQWSDREKPISEQIRTLRRVPDDKRAEVTRQLAIEIGQLPAGPNKLRLAGGLANLATEGDFGHGTLQDVATTLSTAINEQSQASRKHQSGDDYSTLAQLVRYEHVTAELKDPRFAEAMAELEAADQRRASANFTLSSLDGQSWTLRNLRGKVVLVNFWATWCPPCRKEMPDLEALYNRFKDRGLVILAISDEDAAKVKPFVAERNITFPVLLDPGRTVHEMFQIQGIPKTFVYGRDGALVDQAIDMRTQKQFLAMLSRARLQ